MIDHWFKKDLQSIYDTHLVAVFIDESGDAKFLLKAIETQFTIHETNSEAEELHVKYLIEKAGPSQGWTLPRVGPPKGNFSSIPVPKRKT